MGKSLSWVIFADTLWDVDADVLSGRTPTPELHGTRFTSKGFGAQWEETAGAVMALAHFLHYRAAARLNIIQYNYIGVLSNLKSKS